MLKTKCLILRKFKSTDWEDLYEYLSDERVVQYEPYGIFSEEECRVEAVSRSKNDSFWAVCLKDSGKLIGNVYLAKQDFDTWELGYVFNGSFQTKGYATEAAKALIDHVLVHHKVHRIIAMCNPLNKSSWRLLERLNFRREGHSIQNIYFKRDQYGQPLWSDTYKYAILASEWLAINQKL